jgi:hypothetical protein
MEDESLGSGLEDIDKGRGPRSNGGGGRGIGAEEDVGGEEMGNGGQGTELEECGLGLGIVEAFGETGNWGSKVVGFGEEGSSKGGQANRLTQDPGPRRRKPPFYLFIIGYDLWLLRKFWGRAVE